VVTAKNAQKGNEKTVTEKSARKKNRLIPSTEPKAKMVTNRISAAVTHVKHEMQRNWKIGWSR
jgi:hypothetical protein